MKILFLNPRIDAEHNISKKLQSLGIALLFPADAKEAVQMLGLHGTSIDMALIHREGYDSKDIGLKFISDVKLDPIQNDLPIILTTEAWGSAECAEHQKGPQGVNAYLKYPFNEDQLLHLIQAILGQSVDVPNESETSYETPHVTESEKCPILEDVSLVFMKPEGDPTKIIEEPGISLEAPQFTEISPSDLQVPSQEGLVGDASVLLEAGALVLEVPDSDGSLLPAIRMSLTQVGLPSLPLDHSALPIVEDSEAERELPYLFRSAHASGPAADLAVVFAQLAEPIGDAVVPGGAAHSPDLETFKKYLLLREQDVAILSNQLKAANEQMKRMEHLFKDEQVKNTELSHQAKEKSQKIQDFEKEKILALQELQSEIEGLHFQVKVKSDRTRVLEHQVREAAETMEHLKERVRIDIRKIRVREKELENRLEIMKKDSEALISARESKIIELKRKLDLLEFNVDLLQDQYSREKENVTHLRDRLARAAQIIRVAGGLLDSPQSGGKSYTVSMAEEVEETDSMEDQKRDAS